MRPHLVIGGGVDSKERFLNACRGLPVDRPPVWIMRQAGRTLPEYQELRSKHSFWRLCRTPDLAAEATLQPVRRFGMDVAVIFSDILIVPAAMGLEVTFTPRLSISPPVREARDIGRLLPIEPDSVLSFVAEAIRRVSEQSAPGLAVLGFSGAPFTLACYMVEGGPSKHFQQIKGMMYRAPGVFADLMERISAAVTSHLRLQIEAGAAAVQLFDTWAGELGPSDFRRFALPYLRRIIAELRPTGVPVIYYVNGVGNLLEAAAQTGADVLGIDWRLDLAEVRRRLGTGQAVQGNLDPAVLFGEKSVIREKVFEMLEQTGGRGHVVNLGHGVIPDTPLAGIHAFVDAVREWGDSRNG
jgi:uroporphyrinogen decarboxylase